MMIQAVLGNPNHPEYGVATIPFPIPHDQYAHCMELLEALEIGDAVKADCKVTKIDSFYTVLKRTEMLMVNVEELNYLAKRLDSFDTGEAAQFQAMAHKLELFELKDLINLTFCCQQATVITDFSDLAAIGRDHYMNLHGGSASVDELNALDGEELAQRLIESGSGTITPYGVVYDNGMKLEQIYDGRFFPCYYYEPNAITVAVTSKSEPEDTEHITWLFLPMVQEEIDRALLRGGITDPADVRLRLEDSQLPNEVDVLLDMEYETLSDLNELAAATDGLSKADMEKLGAVVMLAEPKSAAQIKNLAENLDLFDFAPGAHTPQEYGKYMIRQSGHFEYDENLDAFYDYEKYGTERMNEEDGMFTDRGYIAYKGYASMEEVLTRRFTHESNGEFDSFARLPDLILMDGGRGQVNIALKVLNELGISIPVCGMVKDDHHRTRGLYFNNVEIPIDRHGEGFKLITRIQDEAHRFAIEFHRSLRSKSQVHSVLDDIEGIGPARRKALMRRYQSLEKIKEADVEDLMQTETMNEKAAQAVYAFFHSAT